MQTVIKLNSAELDEKFLYRIKEFMKGKKGATIMVTINDTETSSAQVEENYFDSLRQSVKAIEQKKDLVTFTLEEFESYNPSVRK